MKVLDWLYDRLRERTRRGPGAGGMDAGDVVPPAPLSDPAEKAATARKIREAQARLSILGDEYNITIRRH
jgi:hypothetical protein